LRRQSIFSPSCLQDVLSSSAATLLPSAARMIFVVHGAVSIGEQRLGNGNSWQVRPRSFSKAAKRVGQWSGALTLPRGRRRPCSWGGFVSRVKRSPLLDLLRRGDSVAFPPGGCASSHVHQVPGIRRIIEGGIRIHTQGRSTAYGPGGAWFESGVEPVFAQAAADRPSRFIRLKILPRTPSW
jgi:hypothetical protein